MFIIVTLVFGDIKLHYNGKNEKQIWPVHSDCKLVRIISAVFETKQMNDYVTIGDTQYSTLKHIDIIVSSVFQLEFTSKKKSTDKYVVLNWSCLQFGEWTPVGLGTCLEVMKPFPEYNGENSEQHTSYRDVNRTCSEFAISQMYNLRLNNKLNALLIISHLKLL